MTELKPAHFRISDALTLTAASAVTIWVGQSFDLEFDSLRFVIHYWLQTFAVTFTFALAAIAVLGPDSRNRTSRSTGRLTLVLISLSLLFSVVNEWYLPIVHASVSNVPLTLATRLHRLLSTTLFDADLHAPAYAFLAAVVTMKIQKHETFTRDWIDLAGMCLGVFWLIRSLSVGLLYYPAELLQIHG